MQKNVFSTSSYVVFDVVFRGRDGDTLMVDCWAGAYCCLALLETFESWTEDVDQGHSVDVILWDIQKAFDKVPKKRLLQKLSVYGIRGKVLECHFSIR